MDTELIYRITAKEGEVGYFRGTQEQIENYLVSHHIFDAMMEPVYVRDLSTPKRELGFLATLERRVAGRPELTTQTIEKLVGV